MNHASSIALACLLPMVVAAQPAKPPLRPQPR
jgi:hypothetical protein